LERHKLHTVVVEWMVGRQWDADDCSRLAMNGRTNVETSI